MVEMSVGKKWSYSFTYSYLIWHLHEAILLFRVQTSPRSRGLLEQIRLSLMLLVVLLDKECESSEWTCRHTVGLVDYLSLVLRNELFLFLYWNWEEKLAKRKWQKLKEKRTRPSSGASITALMNSTFSLGDNIFHSFLKSSRFKWTVEKNEKIFK